ncbi:MAG: endolytic transglycosylase MltG [Nitrospinae bacterium]|nr:endolytic transglycosylase MltG [Nitrospinota bacterium]
MLSIKRTIWVLAGSVFFVSAMVLSGLFYFYQDVIHSPVSPSPGPAVIFLIPKGASFSSVAADLKKNGLLPHPYFFDLFARRQNKRGSLKAGEYSLDSGMSPAQILDILTEGRSIQLSLTVPEGFNLREIADRLEKMGAGSAEEFLKAARDREILERHGVPASSFEGYLFPDTYNFSRGTREADILIQMAGQFVKKARTEDISRGVAESGLTFHEVITLASLIEKETGLEEEKSFIAAVFLNRLKKGMLLQCDPTVIYGIENFDGNIRKKDLKIDSPYNTYRYKGLPPGPIANPGLGSIKAALNPAPEKYIYFVSKKDGGHYFSSSLEEHNHAVAKYQLNKS